MSNAIHTAVQKLTEQAIKEFPNADYLVAVKLPADAKGSPTVTVYAGAGLEPVQTDLRGVEVIPANNGKEFRLMPTDKQLLQIRHPNATVLYCTNRPRWFWLELGFTEL